MTLKQITSAAGKARMSSLTPLERSALAQRGGIARSQRMTPEERRLSAQRALKARWDRYRAAKRRECKSVKNSDVRANTLAHSPVDVKAE